MNFLESFAIKIGIVAGLPLLLIFIDEFDDGLLIKEVRVRYGNEGNKEYNFHQIICIIQIKIISFNKFLKYLLFFLEIIIYTKMSKTLLNPKIKILMQRKKFLRTSETEESRYYLSYYILDLEFYLSQKIYDTIYDHLS